MPQNFQTRFAPDPNLRKNQQISRSSFLQEPCTTGQMNCGFEHLTKTFLPIFRDKILHKPKRTWFFQMIFLAVNFFPLETSEVFLKIRPKTFRSQSEKSSVIKLIFKTNVFPQKVPPAYNAKFWQLYWSFLPNLKRKSLKIRKYLVRFFFQKSCLYQMISWTYKRQFCQLYRKIFDENMKKFRLKTEEDLEKISFFQRKFFYKDVAMDT